MTPVLCVHPLPAAFKLRSGVSMLDGTSLNHFEPLRMDRVQGYALSFSPHLGAWQSPCVYCHCNDTPALTLGRIKVQPLYVLKL